MTLIRTVCLLLACARSIAGTPSYWETLPVGIHGGIRNRPAGDIAYLTKFRVVVMDPAEGPECTSPYHACCNASAAVCAVENNFVRTLKSVKAVDKAVITMVYINSILMMPYFTLSRQMYANASELLLRDRASKLMSFAGDHPSGFFCSNFPTYVHQQTANTHGPIPTQQLMDKELRSAEGRSASTTRRHWGVVYWNT